MMGVEQGRNGDLRVLSCVDLVWCSITRKKAPAMVQVMVNPWTQEVVMEKEDPIGAHRGVAELKMMHWVWGCRGL